METTDQLGMPYLMPAQAQKHVTHNEALRMLDALVQMSVKSAVVTSPPENPSAGESYIVAVQAGGVWEGKDGNIASWQDGAWAFFKPQKGWIAYNADTEEFVFYTGDHWTKLQASSDLTKIGVNTQSDETNRFAVSSEASLFTHAGNGHQIKINKNQVTDFASLVFQTSYSGRAEFGLTGTDDFSVKVSPDGANWVEALKVDGQTGAVSLPSTPLRLLATHDIHIFVRPDGNDLQKGDEDTPEKALATIQKAIDLVCSMDLGTYSAVIHIADGVYNESVLLKSFIGSGTITLQGNVNVPDNVVIDTTHHAIFGVGEIGNYHIEAMKLRGAQNCLYMDKGAKCTFDNIIYDGSGTHLYARAGGSIELVGSMTYSIAQNSFLRHIYANLPGSNVLLYGATISCPSTTTQMSGEFIRVRRCSMVNVGGVTFSNASNLAGNKYICSENAIMSTGGTAASLPGDVAGVTSTGGVVT